MIDGCFTAFGVGATGLQRENPYLCIKKPIIMIRKKTKIVATLGPATLDYEVKKQMVAEGVNVFRFNFSHADYDVVKEQLEHIRRIREELQTPVGTLADLQGPKLRIGHMKEGTVLHKGDEFVLTNLEKEGDSHTAYINYQPLPSEVQPGELILLDDGKIHLRVKSTDRRHEIVTEVLQGGPLASRKGLNLPESAISVPSVTEKDKRDLAFALENEIDWIALSFVRKAQDILDLKAFMRLQFSADVPVIAKIEKPEAVENFDSILEAADGVMVARGDLGIEIPMEQVPLIQKQIVYKAKDAAKPVIIATQMMESMINSLIPSRAEVNDVANAVIDGADAVMLSGETSVGQYPVEVIRRMSKIILASEEGIEHEVEHIVPPKDDPRFITKMICFDAAESANDVGAKVITTLTSSGFSAAQVASHRPESFIAVFTKNRRLINRLTLFWGVYPYFYDREVSTDETIRDIIRIIREEKFVEPGDFVINLTSMPIREQGMVNTLRLTQIH